MQHADFSSKADGVIMRLADGPASLGMIRKLYWDGLENTYSTQLDLEARMQSEAGLTADHTEGVTAFREKRQAQFKGS